MTRYRTVVLAFLLVLLPSSLRAQSQMQFAISGFGGVYVPAADVLGGVLNIPGLGDVAATFGQGLGISVGGRLAIWPSRRLGIEAEAAYLSSDFDWDFLFPPDSGVLLPISGDESANLTLASLSVVLALIRPPLEPLVVYVSGGVGFVSRGGDGYDEFAFEETDDVAAVFGLGLKYGISRGLWLRADVRDYLSSFKDEPFDSELQNDFLITAGLEVTVGGG
jgi:hypothetical protein